MVISTNVDEVLFSREQLEIFWLGEDLMTGVNDKFSKIIVDI